MRETRYGGRSIERILPVEDDAALWRGIRMALENTNIAVTLCGTLSKARRRLSAEDFSLLILDVNLPDGSGLTLLREQKALHPETPVILLTANDLELDEVTGLEAGADDYITKPFSLAVLRSVGMTARQLQAMLALEGLLYTLGAVLLAFALVLLTAPLAQSVLEGLFWFLAYRFTLTPVLAALPVFAVLGVVIPVLSSRHNQKHSLVEQLRQE